MSENWSSEHLAERRVIVYAREGDLSVFWGSKKNWEPTNGSQNSMPHGELLLTHSIMVQVPSTTISFSANPFQQILVLLR